MAKKTTKGRAKRKKLKQSIIANMGLFWRRDRVLWVGNRGVGRARLLGVRAKAKTAGEVDFWKQAGIYVLYADYKLIYVGQGGLGDRSCLGNRVKHHLNDDLAGRWDTFSWFGIRRIKKNNKLGARFQIARATQSDLANLLEGILIAAAEPPMNRQKGRFGDGVERYIQVEDAGGSIGEQLKGLEAKLEKKVKGW